MKRFISLCLALAVSVGAFGIMGSANRNTPDVSPYYTYAIDASSNLAISSSKATCKSSATGGFSVTKISATQYLQKKNGTKWETVSNATWSDSVNNNSLTMTNSKSNLGSGTYRLKTVFKVYCGNSYEEIEKLSQEVTI